jgi:hypothetical protein
MKIIPKLTAGLLAIGFTTGVVRGAVSYQGMAITLFAAGLVVVFWFRARTLSVRACVVGSVQG